MAVSRSVRKKVLQKLCDTPPPLQRDDGQTTVQLNTEAFFVPGRDPSSLEHLLLVRGIRLTEQRRAILRVIEMAPQCANVGVICRRARSVNPRINRATVYRTVALLKRHGVLSDCGLAHTCAMGVHPAVTVAGNQVRMKCLGCAKVIEFECCQLGEFAACIEKDCQFRISTTQLDIQGYCRQCRTMGTPLPPANSGRGREPVMPTTAD